MAEFPSGKTLDGGLAMPIQCPSFEPGLPAYLRQTYWWAYLDPRAVRFFDQQVIVNSILWGNFVRLKEAALAEVDPLESARMLQVACVYGDFTPSLASRMGAGSHLDVVDVAPIQLRNLERKLESQDQVNLHLQDASKLGFADESFDQVQVFFLLHELPDAVRRKAVREALRVTRRGGKLVFVDYHRPTAWNPHRYFMPLVFKLLEPYALDMWELEIESWLPAELGFSGVEKTTYFGDLYQKVVVTR
jgi:ubiquinone/menaquinone biosynthesis C-methylase UbiE